MSKELTWRKAIEKVLSEATGVIHYDDIANQIVQQKLRTNLGATPATSVNVELGMGIRKEGDSCPFLKVGKGLYIWRAKADRSVGTSLDEPEEEKESQYDVISSFGMFWRREAIEWVATSKILGMQQIGAKPVDFFRQLGIYLLYDGREVIYVGRATDRPMGRRLYEHTIDRLSTRWDRFSWFGLFPVSEGGELGILPPSYVGTKIIPAMEAILIESLEPRQNRKRGDDLSAVEYIQMEDPEVRKKLVKQSMDIVLSKM